jgi:hypothetical protein
MRRKLAGAIFIVLLLIALVGTSSANEPIKEDINFSSTWFAGLIYVLGIISAILILVCSKRIDLIAAYWLLTGSLGLLGFNCAIVGVYLESKTAATTGLYMIIIGTGTMALSGIMATIASNQQQKECVILQHDLTKIAINDLTENKRNSSKRDEIK